MKPCIADITRLTYPNLKDGENVKKFKSLRFFDDIFFFTHNWPEEKDKKSESTINKQEADFIISFA